MHFAVFDINSYIGLPGSAKAPMIAWLAADLAKAAAAEQRALVPWIVVCAHVPMYSSDGNTPELIKDVEPLMFEFGVDLYLAGHNHYVSLECGNTQCQRACLVATRSVQLQRARSI